MSTDAHPPSSSPASPGQSARRDSLVRLYDKMDDVAKRDLLQFAEDLFREGDTEPERPAGILDISAAELKDGRQLPAQS